MSHYLIEAIWDPEATVWVATSEDVPGLATESASLEALAHKLRTLVPELLEANDVLPRDDSTEISFEIVGHREELIRLAS
ncbi:MAG TPA: DUF1902 domain-containing protein [Thermoanaerobaculia bacterium]|nr:DUF1902 domain-containing protein [Thermoanaerobaculia bacterium]